MYSIPWLPTVTDPQGGPCPAEFARVSNNSDAVCVDADIWNHDLISSIPIRVAGGDGVLTVGGDRPLLPNNGQVIPIGPMVSAGAIVVIGGKIYCTDVAVWEGFGCEPFINFEIEVADLAVYSQSGDVILDVGS